MTGVSGVVEARSMKGVRISRLTLAVRLRGIWSSMEEKLFPSPAVSSPFRWFPEFWELSRKRFRPQARLMGLALIVGVAAGIGAILFFTACQVVSHYALEELAGYQPVSPGGEPPLLHGEAKELRP